MSAATRHLIRSAAAQLRAFRRSGAASDLAVYKYMRSQVRTAITLERRLKFESSIQMNRTGRETWNLINATLGKAKATHCLDSSTARSFNKFFCSVGADTQSGVRVSQCPDEVASGPPRILSTKFDLRPASVSDVRYVLRSLSARSAPGPDGLPVSLLKSFMGRLTYPLMHVFNSSISSGVVPTCWKTAEVVPIFKGKGDPKSASSYRPISLLNIASKILERLVSIQLRNYLDDCSALSDEQFGFRPNHSVEHALISLTESIRSSIDDGNVSILASLDLSRAFDTVNHTMLLEKLCQHGIDDPWFEDYLSGRSQFVRGCRNDEGRITSGVPQGSVLGPMLFNLFVNDLPSVGSGLCTIVQYADDTQVMVSGPPEDVSVIATRLQVVLRRLAEWFSRNRLALNVSKSQVIVFGSRATLRRVDLKSVDIFNTVLPVRSSILSLGVTIDRCLTWSEHIGIVTGKCMGMLIRISLLRHVMPIKTIVLLINALVLPHLRFCSSVWGSCNVTQGKRVNKIIKFARRIAGREAKSLAWHGDIHTERNIAALKIIRRCLLSPQCMSPLISSLFKERQSVRNTRQWEDLDLDIPKTDFKKASLSYNGSKLWNTLPSWVRHSSRNDFLKYILEKADTGELQA